MANGDPLSWINTTVATGATLYPQHLTTNSKTWVPTTTNGGWTVLPGANTTAVWPIQPPVHEPTDTEVFAEACVGAKIDQLEARLEEALKRIEELERMKTSTINHARKDQ